MGAAVSSRGNSTPCLSSPMVHEKKGFVTTMAPSSFCGILGTNCLQKCQEENILSQLPSKGKAVDMEMIDNIPMLNGVLDDQPVVEAARKTMTLDLLGAEGGKGMKFQAQENVGFGGLVENMTYFRNQGAMGYLNIAIPMLHFHLTTKYNKYNPPNQGHRTSK